MDDRNRNRPLVNSSLKFPPWIRLTWSVAALLVWWGCSQSGIASSLIVPSPMSVISAAHDIGLDLLYHIMATFLRGIGGFILGALLGFALGVAVQFSSTARTLLEPAMDASRPVPAVALLPFLILIFGFSEVGRFVLIILSVTIFCSLSTAEALSKVPEAWVRYARISGLSRGQIFRRILIPGTLPWLSGPFRLSLALSFTITIAAEFMGAQRGLGFLINVARVNLATPTIWLAILLIGLICQVADVIVVRFFRKRSSWYQTSD